MSDDVRSVERSGAQGGIVSALQTEISRLNGLVRARTAERDQARRALREVEETMEAQAAAAIAAEENARRSTVTTEDGWTVVREPDGSCSRWRGSVQEWYDPHGVLIDRLGGLDA